MSVKTSTGLRNGMLVGDSFKGLMDGSFLRIYAGPVPASADDAIGSATLLCTVSNNSSATGLTFDSVAVGGVLSKTPAEVWSGNNVAAGTASFYRLETSADDQDASSTLPRVQGTVGVLGADLNLSSVALANGAPQAIDYFTMALPSA